MISKQEIEQLNSIPVADVANLLGIVILKNNKAMCFSGHDNKTPSLSFKLKENYWYCFGCDQGGNNIKLVEEVLNIDFLQAVKWLKSDLVKVTIPITKKKKLLVKIKSKRNIESKKKKSSCCSDVEVYEWIIKNSKLAQKGLNYLKQERGFTPETIKHFQIKELSKPKEFLAMLIEKWSIKRLRKCGLLPTESTRFQPAWWDRSLWIPFFKDDRIVYLQRRRFMTEGPKYVNLYNLSKPYYNIDVLFKLNPCDKIYICEGIPDTMMAYQINLKAIGVLGVTSNCNSLVKQLLPYEVFVIPDNDQAGAVFFKKISDLFMSNGKIVERLYLGDSKDICDYVNKVF